MPNDFLAGNEFCYLLFGTVHVLDTVCELGTEFVGIALDFSPPCPDVVDRIEDFFRRLVYRKRSRVTFSLHRLVSSPFICAAAFVTSW